MFVIGDIAPEFCLPDMNMEEYCLQEYRGQWVVLYFYPKDNTPGCTKEAVDFSENIENFKDLNATIIGISPDSAKSHVNFVNKKNLKILLLSDTDHKVLKQYGVWKTKQMFGKEYLGVVRTTFLISPTGKIEQIWDKVKVNGHVEDVMCQLKEMN